MSSLSRGTRRSALLLTALVLLPGGCRQPTEPRPVDGLFVLRTVGANPVPAVTGFALNTEFSVVADTIALRGDGSGEWMSTSSRRDLITDARDTTRTVKRFDHSRRGPTVRATGITCEPLCDVLPDEAEFHLEGDWLTFGFGPGAQRYERVAPAGAL